MIKYFFFKEKKSEMELNVLVIGEDNVGKKTYINNLEKFGFPFENNNIKFNFIMDNNESEIDAYILLYDAVNYNPKTIDNMIESILNKNPEAYIYLGANKCDLYKLSHNIQYYQNSQHKDKFLHQAVSGKTLYNIDKCCLYFARKHLKNPDLQYKSVII